MKILTLPPLDGPEVALRILATRWRTIIVSILVVMLMAALSLVIRGPHYTASTGVEIASVSVDPAAGTKAGASIDTASELSLVRSGSTAQKAAEKIGGGVTPQEIVNGVSVITTNNSNVLTIQWTDSDPERARAMSSAIAEAYLLTRSELILQRVEAISDELRKEIEAKEKALAELNGDSPAISSKRESYRSAISSLNARLANLVGYAAPTGRIVTPDSSVALIKTPSKKTVLLASVAVGLFVGLMMALVRERTDKFVRSPRHLAQVVSAPVWSPDVNDATQLRWFGAARMATLIGKDKGVLALLVGSSETEAPLLITALSAAQTDLRPDRHLRVLDLDGQRSDLLQSLADVDQVVIAPGATMQRADIAQLVDQIDLSGCELTGAFYVPPVKK